MIRQFIILLLASSIALLATLAQAETLNVRLVMSNGAPPYQQFSDALSKALLANNVNAAIVSSQVGENLSPDDDPKIDLTISVGLKATEHAIANFRAPLLSAMVSRNDYETLIERHSSRRSAATVSAIYLDQPWDRQFNFIRAALPNLRVVGVLYSPDNNILLPRLPRGMSLNARSVLPSETLFDALENVLSSSDVLLVIHGNEIYSSSNMRNILLTSYRKKVPLIGISQAYVNAGALCAIFSTPEQVAGQVLEAIVSFATNRQLPEPRYPTAFSIAVNQQVARSLEIVLDAPEVIRQRMDSTVEKKK